MTRKAAPPIVRRARPIGPLRERHRVDAPSGKCTHFYESSPGRANLSESRLIGAAVLNALAAGEADISLSNQVLQRLAAKSAACLIRI